MAVRMMASFKSEEEAMAAVATGREIEIVKKHQWGAETLFMETTYKGVVLSTWEVNGYDDSDFYALVWSEERGAPERVMYASTRGWTYPNSATVDATPETVAKWEAYEERFRLAREERRAATERAQPRKGRTATVVKGRKVPLGTTGVIIWVGAGQYGERVGIKDAAGTVHWTASSNVKVAESEEPTERPPFMPAPGFVKGAKVQTETGAGKIFWVGECKRTPGATRVGVKMVKGGHTFFAGASELTLAA